MTFRPEHSSFVGPGYMEPGTHLPPLPPPPNGPLRWGPSKWGVTWPVDPGTPTSLDPGTSWMDLPMSPPSTWWVTSWTRVSPGSPPRSPPLTSLDCTYFRYGYVNVWTCRLNPKFLGLKHTGPKWDIVDQILCVFGPKFRSRVQRFPGPKSRPRVQRFQNAIRF